ncbi:MAG: FixH family protein [Gemmatimonadota bacterium]
MAWIRKDRIWPTIVITVLGANVVLGIVLARVANSDSHFAVEPDYYRKAVGWDSTMAQGSRNHALGWQVIPHIGPVASRGTTPLELEIRDATGEPLVGATVSVDAMAVAYANDAEQRDLPATAQPGHYAAPVNMAHTGLWEYRVSAFRGTERFTANLRLDLSTTAAAQVVVSRPGDAPR